MSYLAARSGGVASGVFARRQRCATTAAVRQRRQTARVVKTLIAGGGKQYMIVSIGLDIVEIARIEKDLERFGTRFVARILGENEKAVYEQRTDRTLFLAGRFAAKEAVVKALGVYLSERPPLATLEIINDDSGRPQLAVSNDITAQLRGARCLLSITHEKNYAAAVAIFEEDK